MNVFYNDPLPSSADDWRMTFDFEPAMHAQEEKRRAIFEPLAPPRKEPIVCLHWLRGLCHKNEFTCERYHIYEP